MNFNINSFISVTMCKKKHENYYQNNDCYMFMQPLFQNRYTASMWPAMLFVACHHEVLMCDFRSDALKKM